MYESRTKFSWAILTALWVAGISLTTLAFANNDDGVIAAPEQKVEVRPGVEEEIVAELPEDLKKIGFRLVEREVTDKPGHKAWQLMLPSSKLGSYYSVREFKTNKDAEPNLVAGSFNSLRYVKDDKGRPFQIAFTNDLGEMVIMVINHDTKDVLYREYNSHDEFYQATASGDWELVTEDMSRFLPLPGAQSSVQFQLEVNERKRTIDDPTFGPKTPQQWVLGGYDPDLQVLRFVDKQAYDAAMAAKEPPSSGFFDVKLELPSSITSWAINEDMLYLQGDEECTIGHSGFFGDGAENRMILNFAEMNNRGNPGEGRVMLEYNRGSLSSGMTSSALSGENVQDAIDGAMAHYHACMIRKAESAGEESANSDGYYLYKSTTGKSSILMNPETGRILPLDQWSSATEVATVADSRDSAVLSDIDIVRKNNRPDGNGGTVQVPEKSFWKLNLDHGERTYAAEKVDGAN